MTHLNTRLATTLLATGAAILFAAPALALNFTVHGYDLGERIQVNLGGTSRSVWTAEFDVSLETAADHIASYCVDVETYLSIGEYETRDVLDAFSDASPADETPRNFAWAGHVMDNYGYDVDLLLSSDVNRDQAITGVQAAIWEGLYGAGTITVSSLSAGAQTVFDTIVNSGLTIVDGPAQVIDLVGNQDQIISQPVPEPSAALLFGLGSILAGSKIRRRDA